MPTLIPSKKFLKDIDKLKTNKNARKKLAKCLALLENNPLHPGLNIEKIVNDPTAWSARVDRKYRLSFEPNKYLPAGNPDWTEDIFLLRLLIHDDIYKFPR
ncbi:MAG: hypothetical protein GY859_08470 [Desulfobacterales bacterium]|nr:hypothetical protein [Desulfobacterales bacterium]